MSEKPTFILEKLITASEKAQPFVCSMSCPCVKKEGEQWTHADVCKELTGSINEAKSLLEDTKTLLRLLA